MAQAVERRLGKAEVTGSNPVSSFSVKAGLSSNLEVLFFCSVPRKSQSNCSVRINQL